MLPGFPTIPPLALSFTRYCNENEANGLYGSLKQYVVLVCPATAQDHPVENWHELSFIPAPVSFKLALTPILPLKNWL